MKVQPEIYKVQIRDNRSYGKKTKEEFLKHQERFKGLDFVKLTIYDNSSDYGQNSIEEEELVLDKNQIFELSLKKISFEVKQQIKVNIDITQQLIEYAEKPIKLIQEKGSKNIYNQKCEVHMPGHSLSLYNEICLKEDCCTDDLQSELNSGWRIIAACPQPDNRRPDYILGRFNPNMSTGGTAER